MSNNEDYGDYSVDDENQLQPEDTLDGDLTGDVLDAGYQAPDHYQGVTAYGMTAEEAEHGETIDQRVRQEEPEVGQAHVGQVDLEEQDPDVPSDDFVGDSDDRPVGQLVAPDEGAHEDRESDAVAEERGRWADQSAEESAMHVVDERSLFEDEA